MGIQTEMNTVIIGMGEVGSAHYEILSKVYPVWGFDLDESKNKTNREKENPENVFVLLIAVRYGEKFEELVKEYIEKYKPAYLNILSTVPPGTTEKFGMMACHSTTRGLHPHLEAGLQTIKKHIGGGAAVELKTYYREAGITCEIHRQARTTELLHILNNCHYGVNVLFAQEAYELCREAGIDYYDYMKYTESNNDGYMALGHKTKVRSILTPPGKQVGGHCLVPSAQLIPKEIRPKMISLLGDYNENKKQD